MPYLSIVIPAYNEESRIGRTLEEILKFIRTLSYETEIAVVNDGSRDRTTEVVRKYQSQYGTKLRLIENPGNRGKGYSVRNGMLSVRGEIRLFMDADLATPLTEVRKVIQPIAEGRYDVVFGSRALDRSLIGTQQSKLRQLIGMGGNLVQYLMTGLAFRDTQCGFKAFRASAAKSIFALQTIEGFGFDPEVLFIAKKQDWRMLETPVRWNHVDGSKVNPLMAPLQVLSEVSCIPWNNFIGRYQRPSTERLAEKWPS